ncbi:MAG: hypothetical protein EA392_02700 [Cryomorphaceae bacterium]|nr:MAG: hypothetical protein EA392_02700 [Cryomorphaceae bacterium]
MRVFATLLIISIALNSCSEQKGDVRFQVIDTDFSKGRLTHVQSVNLVDLERFHGHLCDGLVVGALAMEAAMRTLYPNQPVDRTNLRAVSKPSPCLTDVAIYLSGGRYQFNTFYVDTAFEGLYIVQRIDNGKAVSVSLNQGVKPAAIDSLGNLAVQRKLSPCGIDSLRALEDSFTDQLLASEAGTIFTVEVLEEFTWNPVLSNQFVKTDVLNRDAPECRNTGSTSRELNP